MSWLECHGCRIKDRVAFDKECRSKYNDIMHTLRKDDNPDAVISYLLDSDSTLSADKVSPRQIGKRAKRMIHKELVRNHMSNQLDAVLSPTLILTQRKRRDLIARLESGENLVEDEKEVFRTIHFPTIPGRPASPHRRHYSPGRPQSPPKEEPFLPKWDHYNTMRTRWRYISPQVRSLVDDQGLLAPSSSTSYIRVGRTQLGGQYRDFRQFQSAVHSQESKTLSFAAKSMIMTRQKEQDAADKIYLPHPFVRHPR